MRPTRKAKSLDSLIGRPPRAQTENDMLGPSTSLHSSRVNDCSFGDRGWGSAISTQGLGIDLDSFSFKSCSSRDPFTTSVSSSSQNRNLANSIEANQPLTSNSQHRRVKMEEPLENDIDWQRRAKTLEVEVSNLKIEILDSERRLLEALVEERKRAKKFAEDLAQMTERFEMSKEAMTSLTTKCLQLEMELTRQQEINQRNEEFMEKLAAQRAADEHCKRVLDDELRKLKQRIRALTEENGTLALRLEISEGGAAI